MILKQYKWYKFIYNNDIFCSNLRWCIKQYLRTLWTNISQDGRICEKLSKQNKTFNKNVSIAFKTCEYSETLHLLQFFEMVCRKSFTLIWYWFPRNAHIFCSWSAISFVRFCAFFAWFAQNWNYFAKCNFFATRVVANWPKFTVSAQNQLIKGLLKNLHANKLWSCYSKLLSFSYIKSSNWGTKINKTEIRIWKLNFDAKFL